MREMGTREKDRDLERLIPGPGSGGTENGCSKSSSPSESPVATAVSLPHHVGNEEDGAFIRRRVGYNDEGAKLWRFGPRDEILFPNDNPKGKRINEKESDSFTFILCYFLLYICQYYNRAFSKVLRSWASKKFMTGCVILFPIAMTFYITWWFIHFVDGLFSPIFAHLGINLFGLGFVTSIIFIFLVGIFMSSWLGASVLELGEWIIKKMPLMSYIYTASKQISAAISPDENSHAFKEVAIIRHPRIGEYAFGFITSTVILHKNSGAEEVCCVYVPTNHLYLGDIFLINSKDIMRPNLSVREGIEIVISGGMSIPKVLKIVDVQSILSPRVGKYTVPQF